MNRLRYPATLLLVTAFAVFQLLATAPLFHPHSEIFGPLVQAKHEREAPALRSERGITPGNADDCPVCMVSGLSAILSPGLAVSAPADHLAALYRSPDAAVRSRVGASLRSRAPPAF